MTKGESYSHCYKINTPIIRIWTSAAAAAKSLQSYPTLCGPIDGSPPGSPVPYGYTVEVTNRFKGLNMLDRMPEELWTEICNIIQEVVTKTMPKRKETQEGKVIV